MSQQPPYPPTEGTPPAPGSPLPPYAAPQQPVYPQPPQQPVYPQPGYSHPGYPQPGYPQPGYAYATPQGYPAGPPVERRVTGLGWTAFGLGIFGFILACIPLLSLWSGIVLLAAFVISIVVLARRGDTKWPGIVGMITSVLGGITAVVVGVFTAVGLMLATVPAAINELDNGPLATDSPFGTDSPLYPDTAWTVDGMTATSSDGMSFTVDSVLCGLPQAETFDGPVRPTGQFCQVDLMISNGSSETQSVYPEQINGLVDGTAYQNELFASTVDGDDMYAVVEPGEKILAMIMIDIPAEDILTEVSVEGNFVQNMGGTVIPVEPTSAP